MKKRVLIIVENMTLPLDRRVWQEATTLRDAGYQVCVICPKMKGLDTPYENLEGVHIYRHALPLEASGALGYLLEYGTALFWQSVLAWRIFFTRGFDVIHVCNPPDLMFITALWFLPLGKKLIFDQHDLCPELFEAKFGGKGLGYRVMRCCERLTFALAKVSIATNQTFREVALTRGGMHPENVFIVQSGPSLDQIGDVVPDKQYRKPQWQHVLGYVGVMGNQDGVDVLLQATRHLVIDQGYTGLGLVLVGYGPEEENLRQLSTDLGLDDHVVFTGRLNGKEMFAALADVDIGVCPDPKNDFNDHLTMNKVMEYMMLSKPVVMFDLVEGRRTAQDAALYAQDNDPQSFATEVSRLIKDDSLRKKLGQTGRQRIEQTLAWEYEQAKLLAAYEKALS